MDVSLWQFELVAVPFYFWIRWFFLRRRDHSQSRAKLSLALLFLYAFCQGMVREYLGMISGLDETLFVISLLLTSFITMRDVWLAQKAGF